MAYKRLDSARLPIMSDEELTRLEYLFSVAKYDILVFCFRSFLTSPTLLYSSFSTWKSLFAPSRYLLCPLYTVASGHLLSLCHLSVINATFTRSATNS